MDSQIREIVLEQFGAEAADYFDREYAWRSDFITFDGHNCEDDCPGWDGESRRCCCDNRRVDWEWENGILWAEAY